MLFRGPSGAWQGWCAWLRGPGMQVHEPRTSWLLVTQVRALTVDSAPWTVVGEVARAAGDSRVWLG